jgi:hypothetical protein
MNPTTSISNELQLRYADDQLNSLYAVLDELHDAASEGQLGAMTTIQPNELVGLLRDLIYTAQETISEIERQAHTARSRAARRNKTDANGVTKEVLNLQPLLRLVGPAQDAVAESLQA